MHAEALRIWGIGIGGALVASAVALAVFAGDPAPPSSNAPMTAGPLAPRTGSEPTSDAVEQLMSKTPSPNPESAAPESAEPVFEAASVNDIAPPPDQPSFIVRFAVGHAMAAAQELAALGRHADARRAAEQGLRRTRDLRGLCFDRFTAGGAEIVLHPCEAVPPAARDRVRREWESRFEAMAGVAYADVNAIASREQR